MIDDPDLVIAARRDGDRLEPDGDGCLVLEPPGPDTKDLEPVVRGVDREQALAIG